MFGHKNDAHEFHPLLVEIEEEPLNPLGRVVFWLIILALVFFLLWTFLGKVDVVVTGKGKFVPRGEIKTIQPLSTGVVRSILIQPGDLVEKGQVLMEIDPSDIDPELESLRNDLERTELEICRLQAQIQGVPFPATQQAHCNPSLLKTQQELLQSSLDRIEKQVRIKKDELVQLTARQQAVKSELEQTRHLLQLSRTRFHRLAQVEDIIGKDRFEEAEKEFTTHRSKIKTLEHHLKEVGAQMAQTHASIELIREEEKNSLLTELQDKEQEHSSLTARIRKADFRSRSQRIASPVKGYVAQLLVHTEGGVVTPAEKLAHIVPVDSPLQVKALIQNKDVGFIAPGMNATIKVDAFNFQKYGTIPGRVLRIAKDSLEHEQLGLVYEAYIEPATTTLAVEGLKTAVTTGMAATVEITVGKRRIIEFFVYPLVKYLDEGMSVR